MNFFLSSDILSYMARKHAGVKALRQTIKRTIKNRAQKDALKTAIKKVTAANVNNIQAMIDKAVKRGLIHANKAARIKSRLAKKLVKAPKSNKSLKTTK